MIAATGMLFMLAALAFALLDAFDLWPGFAWGWVYDHSEGLYSFFGVGFFVGVALTLGSGIWEAVR